MGEPKYGIVFRLAPHNPVNFTFVFENSYFLKSSECDPVLSRNKSFDVIR